MIKMKRTYLLVLILFLSVSLSAQKDKQAREILDKTANALQQAGGIRATFGGTGNGTLLLKGNRFYLNSGGIQSLSLIHIFIAELPTGYRTILNLAVFEEMPHKEIAKTLGINEHSSSSQLYRAKCILAQKIKEYLTRQSL